MQRVYLSIPVFLFAVMLFSLEVAAQLDNKPFSFGSTPDGGVGMSIGGRQAIINQEILGLEPKNMLRGVDSSLLELREGPENTVIVNIPGGDVIPGYKGSSWKRGDFDLSAGVFNPYFSTGNDSSGVSSVVFINSQATVSTWTTRVTSEGRAIPFSPASSVDVWTSYVYN